MSVTRTVVLALALALALAACGGSSAGPTSPPAAQVAGTWAIHFSAALPVCATSSVKFLVADTVSLASSGALSEHSAYCTPPTLSASSTAGTYSFDATSGTLTVNTAQMHDLAAGYLLFSWDGVLHSDGNTIAGAGGGNVWDRVP